MIDLFHLIRVARGAKSIGFIANDLCLPRSTTAKVLSRLQTKNLIKYDRTQSSMNTPKEVVLTEEGSRYLKVMVGVFHLGEKV